jgi:uncharacterized protein YoxC
VKRLAVGEHAARTRAWLRDERGEASHKTTDLLLFGTVATLLLAVFLLLVQTLSFVESIRKKTVIIATTGRGINDATDSVLLLTRINKNVSSINGTVTPIEGQLRQVLDLATSIDGRVTSITGSVQTVGPQVETIAGQASGLDGQVKGIGGGVNSIGGTVGKLNPQVKVVDKEVADVLGLVKKIEIDVNTIVGKLNTTIGGVEGIKSDTGNIVTGVRTANRSTACIYRKLGGTTNDCTTPGR